MRDEDVVVVSVSVVIDQSEHIARAAEVLARAAAGLVLEGISVSVSMMRSDADEVEP